MDEATDEEYGLYGIEDSRWTSPNWRWGYGIGIAHDCAAICRRRWNSPEARQQLVDLLLSPDQSSYSTSSRVSFEEIKLILALAWQRGSRTGADGGPNGGYGDILAHMAEARRYEIDGTPEDRMNLFVEDMKVRFPLICSSSENLERMKNIIIEKTEEDDDDDNWMKLDFARRKCSGLVLDAMGFVESGL